MQMVVLVSGGPDHRTLYILSELRYSLTTPGAWMEKGPYITALAFIRVLR